MHCCLEEHPSRGTEPASSCAERHLDDSESEEEPSEDEYAPSEDEVYDSETASSSNDSGNSTDEYYHVVQSLLTHASGAVEQKPQPEDTDRRYREPLAPQLVTLSLLPANQWKSLAHLDSIKVRSAPCQDSLSCHH